MAVLAFLSLTAFALLSVWARFDSPAPWEPAVMDAVALSGGPLDPIVVGINLLGNLLIWIPLVAVVAIATGRVRGAAVGLVVALTLASDTVAFGVKLLVERERPEGAAVNQFFGFDSFAFPSGHVVRAVALVGVLWFIFAPPRWRLPIAIGASVITGAVMGYARVALGVHWPTDALGGFLLGFGWLAMSALLLLRERTPDRAG
ncbi:MAG TPA: phosphatase PAP2 family protein [Candidatus Limnocylindrales bacterium]|nr:phosphatase PAP2 family protein [Candidatus Limnocylindrales bacterium]